VKEGLEESAMLVFRRRYFSRNGGGRLTERGHEEGSRWAISLCAEHISGRFTDALHRNENDRTKFDLGKGACGVGGGGGKGPRKREEKVSEDVTGLEQRSDGGVWETFRCRREKKNQTEDGNLRKGI